MRDINFFLAPGGAATISGGGGGHIEDPAQVENIVFQTRAVPLDAFETRLSGDLMQVFGAGAEELGDVVRALNAAGSRDVDGVAWTDESFVAQMAASAAATFAPAATRAVDEGDETRG
jgi:hypothetical protein